MESQAYTLKEILYGAMAIITIVGAVGGLYHLWLKSKLESLRNHVTSQWKAKDSLEDRIGKIETSTLNRLHRMQVEAIEKFATKSELAEAISRFERHLEQLGKKIDDNQHELLSKILEAKT